jgi:hypothetical protein
MEMSDRDSDTRIEAAARADCCADWPKPCSYHEGWADGRDVGLAEADKHAPRYERVPDDDAGNVKGGFVCDRNGEWLFRRVPADLEVNGGA